MARHATALRIVDDFATPDESPAKPLPAPAAANVAADMQSTWFFRALFGLNVSIWGAIVVMIRTMI